MSRKKHKDPRKILLGELQSIHTALGDEKTALSDEKTALSEQKIDLSDQKTALSDETNPLMHQGKESESGTDPSNDQVPLLDDVVAGGTSLTEEAQTDTQVFGEITEQDVLGDDLFQALLGDEWSTSTAEILEKARESIEKHNAELTPAFTDKLIESLEVRIGETVNAWLHTVIIREADDLRSTLLEALSEEIASSIGRLSNTDRSEGSDGQ